MLSKKQKSKEEGILVLTRGILQNGNDFYAYVLIPENKYLEFVKAEQTGNYNLAEFGEVKKYFIGSQIPTKEVMKEMEKLYNAKPDFEKQVLKEYLKENNLGDDGSW